MTWGKTLLNWTSDAQSALAMMIDLNHRYALDGQDPASFGGILWCLGQFDRPFPPARPIFGIVRDRSTAEHAQRLDPDRYFQHATRPRREPRLRVAVVGAGISGLICARTLVDHGTDVVVFEKSRGAGGRMATRRTAEGAQFDHGAQYLTVRDGRFERYVKSWLQDGIVAPWESRIGTLTCGRWEGTRTTTPRYVGVPGMSAICRHLAADLDIQFGRRVAQPERDHGGWRLRDIEGEHLGVFDCVITSAPAPQSAELLSECTRFAAGSARGQYERLLGRPACVRPVTGTSLRRCLRSRIARCHGWHATTASPSAAAKSHGYCTRRQNGPAHTWRTNLAKRFPRCSTPSGKPRRSCPVRPFMPPVTAGVGPCLQSLCRTAASSIPHFVSELVAIGAAAPVWKVPSSAEWPWRAAYLRKWRHTASSCRTRGSGNSVLACVLPHIYRLWT